MIGAAFIDVKGRLTLLTQAFKRLTSAAKCLLFHCSKDIHGGNLILVYSL